MGGVGQLVGTHFAATQAMRSVLASPGDRFTATEVFQQHANTDVPVEWKMIYHSNNRNAYNQVTQITHWNFNWGMLDVFPYL